GSGALVVVPYIRLLRFSFNGSSHHRDLHSFPTRRSSDLFTPRLSLWQEARPRTMNEPTTAARPQPVLRDRAAMVHAPAERRPQRSEEHTSELQSRFDLVCRLLLEKKKTTTTHHMLHHYRQ